MQRFDLVVHGQTLSVATSLTGCSHIVRRLFRPYVVEANALDAAPGRPADVVVVAEGSGVRAQWGGRTTSVDPNDLASELEHLVTRAILDRLPHLLHLHGAAVVGRSGAALALGASGSGKSTIATCWSVDGRPILGDDVVFLDRDALLHPLKKPLKVDAERIEALGLTLDETVFWEPGATEAWLDPEEHGGWGGAAPVVGLVLLERVAESRVPGGVDSLQPLPGPRVPRPLSSNS